MRRALAIIACALALAACKPGASITCPTLKTHSAAFWRGAEAELRVILKTSPHIVTLLKDYELTQDAIRACIKRKKD